MRFRLPRLAVIPRLALAAGLAFATPLPAVALTIELDFVTALTTDIFTQQTTVGIYTGYGFTGLNVAQIQSASLAAIKTDYLGFPTIGANALSTLPNGKELNINFVLSTTAGAPSNGDADYYVVAIGNDASPLVSGGALGAACFTCVRKPPLVGPTGAAIGNVVGSILVDNIAGLAGLASTDAQRINLLVGTISHEIGHALSLDHPLALPNPLMANPGASAYSLMASGALPSSMPNDQRILDRAFSYSEFDQLIRAVGLRDAPAGVPEPDPRLLFALVILLLIARPRLPRLFNGRLFSFRLFNRHPVN